MATDTVMMRVKVTTKARIDAEIARLVAAHERGEIDDAPVSESNQPNHKGVTYDALLNWLLDQREVKRKGRQEYARRARARKRAAVEKG